MPVFASRRPPLDGTITVIPGLLDFHAEHNPNCPWAYLASDEEHPVTSISFLEYSRATHRVAHALRPGREGPENERVALLINCDSVLYIAMISGMIRAGLVVRPFAADSHLVSLTGLSLTASTLVSEKLCTSNCQSGETNKLSQNHLSNVFLVPAVIRSVGSRCGELYAQSR